MLNRLWQPGQGQHRPDERDLALNLSFVLHERSTSRAVQSAVRASLSHAQRLLRPEPEFAVQTMSSRDLQNDATVWLTATIGLPNLLASAIKASPDQVIAVDGIGTQCWSGDFFRAPAQLVLPNIERTQVGAAAMIVRPDRRTGQLVVTGIHDWPDDRDGAIRSLERLIQAHAGQWMPPRALWAAPAETLLASEVY